MSMNTGINSAAISCEDDDRYGFSAVAKSLAQSITALDKNVSTVIGIEGKWGTGKTSMLNLLLKQIQACTTDGTHVLHIAPWLNAPEQSPIRSLLLPVAAIVAEEDERRQPRNRKWFCGSKRKKQSERALNILNYLQQTSGKLVSIVDFAGNFIPSFGVVAQGMETFSELDLSAQRKTTATLRAEIEESINKLGLNFIVIIDDLDRLEPTQAVEVIRLVKSVADFSRFHYVLCYDRQVLSHAVEQGLGVQDGNQYLQKIVQISFSLPRPETFDLRREFKSGAVALYESVNATFPDEEMLTDLDSLIDTYGASLTTPREVCIALNALKFRYAGLRDYVYFPDLCFLQIIRTTNIGLYDWIEHYLTEWSVVESGDGSVSDEERDMLGNQLKEKLMNFPSFSARAAFMLGFWIPGISGFDNESISVFSSTTENENYRMTARKRLGSNIYWRYYFAFSAPQNVLPQSLFDELLVMASDSERYPELSRQLLDNINSNGVSSRTWFEHILSRLTNPVIASLTYSQCGGLVWFFVNYGDTVLERYRIRNPCFFENDLDVERVVDSLLRRMKEENQDTFLTYLESLFIDGDSWYWISRYVHHLLRQNGLSGDNPTSVHERVFSDDELNGIRITLATRLNDIRIKNKLFDLSNLLGYFSAWQEITSVETVRTWVSTASNTDQDFLKLLYCLRYKGVSSARGPYLALDLSYISKLLDDEKGIIARLELIDTEGLYPQKIKEIREAISNNRH
ncbi:P-loop NTPase fold protein [Pectobacterium versatile]|uniref:KAP family P-loop NTPase fold protein n=1 Tax=Pectobacterium versatile TaxID=2488639 RepID=UPI002B249E5A|nr:P-loop NTPase fold protein [Pectobacterium versatile]